MAAATTLKAADLAANGIPDLQEDGRPDPAVIIIDLDDVEALTEHEIRAAAAQAAAAPQPVVGHIRTASGAVPRHLLEALSCTVAPPAASHLGRSVITAREPDHELEGILRGTDASPVTAAVLDDVLRLTTRLPIRDGLQAESLAYSMLLNGHEFASWRADNPRRRTYVPPADPPILLTRMGSKLFLEINRQERRNAFSRDVRDGFLDAMDLPRIDDTIDGIHISGLGPAFCSGGDLDEFGSTPPELSYFVRRQQNPALRVHELAQLVQFSIHGACIGAGLEIAAFATRVHAFEDAYFQLPELTMGLIPGAGGTVSVPRRIGRWRTAWLVLTGARLAAETAKDWGLIDVLLPTEH